MDRVTFNARRFARPAALLTAALILVQVFICASRAYAYSVVPNAFQTSYTLVNGGNTPDFAIAASNSPVEISGTCNTFPNEGAGFVNAVYTPGSSGLTWTGDKAPSSPTIPSGGASGANYTSGFTYSTGGGVIFCYVGFGGTVRLETGLAGAASHVPNVFHIHNGSGGTRSVTIRQVW